jgi:hypothetical protein
MASVLPRERGCGRPHYRPADALAQSDFGVEVLGRFDDHLRGDVNQRRLRLGRRHPTAAYDRGGILVVWPSQLGQVSGRYLAQGRLGTVSRSATRVLAQRTCEPHKQRDDSERGNSAVDGGTSSVHVDSPSRQSKTRQANVRLRHPHLMIIHHVGKTDRHLYYVMDPADDVSGEPASLEAACEPATCTVAVLAACGFG